MSIYHLYKGKDENDGLDLEQQKQNISSFIKAQFSAENLVFFIGSGCSVPAIPLMSQTMKAIIGKHDDILCVIKKFLDTKNVNLLIDSLDDKDILKGVIVQSCKSHSLETIADLYNYIIQTQLLEKEQLLEIYVNFCSSFLSCIIFNKIASLFIFVFPHISFLISSITSKKLSNCL